MQVHRFYGVINLKTRSKHVGSFLLWCNTFKNEK